MSYLATYIDPQDSERTRSDTLCQRCWQRNSRHYLGDLIVPVTLCDPDRVDGSACSYCGIHREPIGKIRIFPEWNRTGSKTGRFRIMDDGGDTGGIHDSEADALAWSVEWPG